MRILIFADVYPPEVSSAAHLMCELAEGLSKNNHEVSVITAYPRHYLADSSKKIKFNTISVENGVKVIRVKTLPLHKVNFILRGISQIILPYIFAYSAKKYARDAEAVISYSPPLPLGIAATLVKKRSGAKFILNVQDIFPQNAIDLGILKNRLLIKFFENMERKVYKTADVITFHSAGGRRFLIDKKNIPENKIILLPNWIKVETYRDIQNKIDFRDKFELKNKFVLLFAGIMGPAQGIKYIAEVAELVSDIPDVMFLLVGDGTEKKTLEALIREKNLKNISIRPFVSKEEYPSLVKDADAGLVCLSPENKTPFIPGKFLGYMAAGKPIIAFLNKESDGFELIKKAECGYATLSDNSHAGAELVRKLYEKKENIKKFGENASRYADENLTVESCIEVLEKIINQ